MDLFLSEGIATNSKVALIWIEYKGNIGYEIYWSYCKVDNYLLLKKMRGLTAKFKFSNLKRTYKKYDSVYKIINTDNNIR